MNKLKEALKGKPSDGGQWTGPKVARWIEKETGREKVWNQRGWDYLKKCDYSWQRPRPKHKKGNKEEQEQFNKDLPFKVKKLQEEHPNSKV
ncbi:Mobile element protein [Geitlerinema sp. FC II]|nr:Mobile element protein [Geitlerinema sp. FC II]